MILYCLFIVAIVIQCVYALYFFVRIFSVPRQEQLPVAEQPGVSVIICARNESENLKKHLPAVLSQKYGGVYEVIVVNDASTDDTEAVLKVLKQRYGNIRDVVVLPDEVRTLKGKKHALSKGVSAAKYEWLLLTDADCMPASEKWLGLMTAPLGGRREIVAGYGGYHKAPGLLNAFTGWETLHTFLQYSTYALAGMPYMAVGRNMACTKSVLERAQQSEVWNALPSGDDDLLVQIAGTKDNTAIVAERAAFTYSHAKEKTSEWVKQKQRHLSTGKYYRGTVRALLGLYGMSHAVMWLAFPFLLFTGYWQVAITAMAVRCIAYWLLWAVTAGRLRERELIFLFPFFDIAWMVYNFVFFPYIALKNRQHWK